MEQKPTIVIKLAQMPACSRGTKTPAHVRVVIHEPLEEREEDLVGPWGVMNRKADFRWFLPAGVGMPQFLSENFTFEPQLKTRHQRLGVRAFEKPNEDVDQYVIKLNPGSCSPRIDNFYLGEYEHEGVVHDVIGFCTHDMYAKIITPGRKGTVVYMLNTAHDYADESFFDHLHLELTKHGFTTLYTKKAAKHFETELEIPLNETGETVYTCPTTGQQAWLRLMQHDPKYHHREIFLLRATKPDHPFALSKDDLRLALTFKTFDWKCRFEVADDFEWVV